MARVPYLSKKDLPEAQRAIYDEIAAPRGAAVLGNAFSALLNSPEAARRVGALGAYLRYQSVLPPAVREATILTVARELQCEYEWRHHEPLARKAGVSDTAIGAIRAGNVPEGSAEATAVRYAQELLRSRRVAPDTFEAARGELGNGGVVELTLTAGYYTMLALSFHALEVELD